MGAPEFIQAVERSGSVTDCQKESRWVEAECREISATPSLAAIAGHAAAEALITRGARAVASAMLTFCNLFDLDEIVLTGPAMANAGSIYARETRAALERSFARRSHPVSVDLSANPRDAAAIGAAAMTLQGSLAPGHGPALAFTTATR